MLAPGDTAPDFTLPDASGTPVSLATELARGPVVLAFYPRDFTPACTAQACMMRDRHDQLESAGFRTLAISAQGEATHAKFARKHDLPHTLLADPDKTVIRAFGVAGPLGLIPRRVTYLINPDRVIADRVVADLNVGRHRAFIDRLLTPGG